MEHILNLPDEAKDLEVNFAPNYNYPIAKQHDNSDIVGSATLSKATNGNILAETDFEVIEGAHFGAGGTIEQLKVGGPKVFTVVSIGLIVKM